MSFDRKMWETWKDWRLDETFNPNKIRIHTNKAIGYLKQAQKFAKEGQKGAVWQRIGDARDELKIADKFVESVNEGHTITFSKEEMAQLHKDGKIEKGGHTYIYSEE